MTDSVSSTLLRGQVAAMVAEGFEVTVTSNDGPAMAELAEREGAEFVPLPMVRSFALLSDAFALLRAVRLLLRLRPDIVNAGTPKAGLIFTVAAWITRVPVRILTLRGLRSTGSTGWRRAVLRLAERLSASASHAVICVSPSLRDTAVAEGLVPPEKAILLGAGSSNGVDAEFYRLTPALFSSANRIRRGFGVTRDEVVVGFVGRVTRDKGLGDLIAAWELLHQRGRAPYLLIVGSDDRTDAIDHRIASFIDRSDRILRTDHQEDVRPYMAAMDVVCLPSRREGLPNIVLEAQCLERPVVTSTAVGCRDAIGPETGLLFPPGDPEALASQLLAYIENEDLRAAHGRRGRQRARKLYDPRSIWAKQAQLYLRLTGVNCGDIRDGAQT